MDKSTKNFISIIICLLVIASIFTIYVFKELNNNSSEISENIVIPVEESEELSVEYSDEEIDGIYTNYNVKINLNNMSLDGIGGVSICNTTIKITSGGTYYFTGTATEANIEIEAKSQDVILVFDNCDMSCSTTSVINCIKARTLVINSVKNSVNTFTDSSTYNNLSNQDEPDGTLFSNADMVINGAGKLVVNANYEDAIVSKDTLKIINTNIEISSVDDGIRGKDYTGIKGSVIVINSNGDGIKSTNTDTNLGYIVIEDCNIEIEAGQDGIQAESSLHFYDSKIKITTTGDTSQVDDTGNTISSKGIKAGNEITIYSGNFDITATDDSIHSNKYIIINGGTFEFSSGDDGIHADNNILINDGIINITKAYEGIEANYIRIIGGNIELNATDDGINVSGGNDSSGFGGPGEMTNSESDSGRKLLIEGGEINVYAEGDGLDSNGSIEITGGNILVAGAVNGGNGALDYDNKCTVTGGSLVIYGANGMWQNPSNDSSQYCITFSYSGSKGDKIELRDEDNNKICDVTTEMSYGRIGFSNIDLNLGSMYYLFVNGDEKDSQELTENMTQNNENGMRQNNRNMSK